MPPVLEEILSFARSRRAGSWIKSLRLADFAWAFGRAVAAFAAAGVGTAEAVPLSEADRALRDFPFVPLA